MYRYFNLPYDSPTVGLYFYAEEYVRFLSDLRKYLSMDLTFITAEQSRYYEELVRRGETNCPIGQLGDVELVFLHYKTPEEAREKWIRRVSRIHWDHLIVKMSEQNLCSPEILQRFDALDFPCKLLFTTRTYNLRSEIVFEDFRGQAIVANDTLHFRKFVDLVKLINGTLPFSMNQRML